MKRMERLADLDRTAERDSEDIVDDLLRASKKGTFFSTSRRPLSPRPHILLLLASLQPRMTSKRRARSSPS